MKDIPHPDHEILIKIVQTKMPFGKYEGTLLCDLPVSYLEWFLRKGGFPEGKLGMMLSTVYEIKMNGLGEMMGELKRRFGGEGGRIVGNIHIVRTNSQSDFVSWHYVIRACQVTAYKGL